MSWTIQQLAALSGASPRALRFYEQKGLLSPKRRSNGYRQFDENDVTRLQRILFFRELDLSIAEIRRILDQTEAVQRQALISHMEYLQAEKERLENVLDTMRNELEGKSHMTAEERFEGFKNRKIAENEAAYGEEAREKYGEAAVEQANEAWRQMSQQDYEQMQKTEEELFAILAREAAGGDPHAEAGRQAAMLHRKWLEFSWDHYSPEAHAGLVHMYTADERFQAYYDACAEGAAVYLRDAVTAWTNQQKD
ncbi:MerR family transcriptional regulator [Alkalicoccus urumqiensis]|uniref:MerR family transcriptional regulator n=1 Tax=Alkalicoccus urumqiensis TaxID=1548213 RepID=A0A2P6MDM4_ALKUR|nr:MerR family transcriptional regulator [Alkalicoccus urumqiensis]PRO64373.1 MerR family transcriptional regulator [Alkalicoccus urumqiensis]